MLNEFTIDNYCLQLRTQMIVKIKINNLKIEFMGFRTFFCFLLGLDFIFQMQLNYNY